MSDEAQQYSVDNQKAAIAEYAARHGFTIVKTYVDLGKSGAVAKHRAGLGELLSDVTSGDVDYKAILVYDVSRWGRFPNSDEAAHYEFLCSNAGIPLHYCAEQFPNDGTTSSSLLKALKRSMAAEFSRELGEKVYRGKNRLVELGFWVGGKPGFGYRRRMVSANGKPKQLMKPGEHKNIKTDRVILVPGPARELRCLRLIFSLAAEGHGATAISRELNERGLLREAGRPWCACSVLFILRNPKYYGCNAWNRTSQRLQQNVTRVDAQDWILKPGAFAPIVSQEMFERATTFRPKSSDQLWSDNEILRCVRRVLKARGRLSETLLQKTRGMPALNTIHRHFGAYRQLYERVGYHFETVDCLNNVYCEPTLRLRRKVVSSIQRMFPDHVEITHLPRKTRSILMVDNNFMVSVVLALPRTSSKGTVGWPVCPYVPLLPSVVT
jgi:DNA invertase Pin-like site-specific DNA recombinase